MDHPIRLIVTDDLRRNRLTVLFRVLLALPHLFVLALWGIAVCFVVLANWFATLFTGKSPEGLHGFLAKFLRYACQVQAYYHLLADPWPEFGGEDGYPVDLEIGPSEPQSRVTVGFRIFLAIPAYILSYVLNLLFNVVAVFAWFACLFTGRMPEGLRNLGAFVLKYQLQTAAYLFVMTDRYPSLNMSESSSPVTAGQ